MFSKQRDRHFCRIYLANKYEGHIYEFPRVDKPAKAVFGDWLKGFISKIKKFFRFRG
jgi:hypothetical protein